MHRDYWKFTKKKNTIFCKLFNFINYKLKHNSKTAAFNSKFAFN